MQITTYLRPDEPFNLSDYQLIDRPNYRRVKHSSLYAISKEPVYIPRRDGNPQHLRADGRDERVIALRNGFGIRDLIQRHRATGKTHCVIHRTLDVVTGRVGR